MQELEELHLHDSQMFFIAPRFKNPYIHLPSSLKSRSSIKTVIHPLFLSDALEVLSSQRPLPHLNQY